MDDREDAARRARSSISLETQHPGRGHRAALQDRRSSCSSRRSCPRSRPTRASTWSRRRCSSAIATRARSRKATTEELEPQIHSTGFFRAKSKSLIGMAQALVEHHGGKVPADDGGARRAAGRRPQDGERRARPRARRARACRSTATSCASRTGSASPSPTIRSSSSSSCAAAMPPERWTRTSDTLILHGRRICRPKPLCDQCVVRDHCDYFRLVVSQSARRQGAQEATRAENAVDRKQFEQPRR